MTNFKKVGLTALAGSLVAFSTQAAEMSVSGGSEVTWSSGKVISASESSGPSIGLDTDLTFSASGDVNGYEVSSFIAYADSAAFESSALTVNMGSMGEISVSVGGAINVNGSYDETYPRAYEENSDAGGNSPSNYVGSNANGNGIIYMAPTINIAGADVSIGLDYSLESGTDTASNGGGVAKADGKGSAYGLGITTAYEGFTFGAYASKGENEAAAKSDEFTGSAFVNYSMGPVSVGYQKTHVDSGATGAPIATTTAKTVGTSTGVFEDESMSIAFNVNENLSISYAETESEYRHSSLVAAVNTSNNVTQDSDSIQVAYSMGAMSIKAYRTEISNPGHDEDAKDIEATEIAIGLAF